MSSFHFRYCTSKTDQYAKSYHIFCRPSAIEKDCRVRTPAGKNRSLAKTKIILLFGTTSWGKQYLRYDNTAVGLLSRYRRVSCTLLITLFTWILVRETNSLVLQIGRYWWIRGNSKIPWSKCSACGGPRNAIPYTELVSNIFTGLPFPFIAERKGLRNFLSANFPKLRGEILANATIFFNCGWPKKCNTNIIY